VALPWRTAGEMSPEPACAYDHDSAYQRGQPPSVDHLSPHGGPSWRPDLTANWTNWPTW